MGWLGRLDLPARLESRLPQWLTAVLVGLSLACVALLLRTGTRAIWPSLIPFGFIFPSILLATLLGRWIAGLTAFVAGGAIIWFLVLPPLSDRLGEHSNPAVLILYTLTGVMMLGTAEAYRQAERRLANERSIRAEAEAERQQLLARELNHRMKNSLATVQAIAAQTLGRAGIDDSAMRTFQERLAALGRAHDLLTDASAGGISLDRLVRVALAPFQDGERFATGGPRLMLPPKKATAMCLALHELATNALKYGALSVAEGRVEVHWELAKGELQLLWKEQAGPVVKKPSRAGFGTRLLERGVASELEGKVSIDFAPEGLRCRILASVDPSGSRQNATRSPNSGMVTQAETPLSGRQAPAPE